MDREKIVNGLMSLKEHCESMSDREDPDDIWKNDVSVLDGAIRIITGELPEEEPQTEIQTDLERLETIIRESERYRLGIMPGMEIKQIPVLKLPTFETKNAPETGEKCEKPAEKATKPTENEQKPQENDPIKRTRASNIDDGKISALYKGKWSVKDIAEEMHISEQTVRNHLKVLSELGKI